MFFWYDVLAGSYLILASPYYLFQMIRKKKYREGLAARLGRLDPEVVSRLAGRPLCWIHTVSVGEVHAARGLLTHLRNALPEMPIVLSTTTETGQTLAARAGADACFYCPLDLPWSVRRYLDALQPRAVLLVETEIWPNLLRACRGRDIPVAVVNGRLSGASFARYRRLGRWWRGVVQQLSLVCARTRREAARFRALGLDASRVFFTGNLKADAAVLTSSPDDQSALAEHFALNGSAPLLVAGCTMPGEEEQVLQAFAAARAAHPAIRLLLAPRHPERFDRVAALVDEAGYRCRRRSGGGPEDAEVLLLDSIGELPAAYGLAVASFVGGSLVPTGGHNLLEPAVHGQPVLFGPHMHNFAKLAEDFREAGAAFEVRDADSLAAAWTTILTDEVRRIEVGARAREIALRDAAVGLRTARVLTDALDWAAL